MKPVSPQHILVSRCDRIGDLVLSLPAIAHLRRSQLEQFKWSSHQPRLWLHCSPYAKAIGDWALYNEICSDLWVDGEKIPEDLKVGPNSNETWGLSLFHCESTVKAFRLAQLKYTLGPRSRLSALWSYQKSIAQHRSRVQKSEMEYNLDLAQIFITRAVYPTLRFQGLAALKVPQEWKSPIEGVDVLIVASNGGSARNWPMSRYLEEARTRLALGQKVQFLIHGFDAEIRKLELKNSDLNDKVTCLPSLDSLSVLIAHINSCGEVISSSTGPLHLAHALGKPVIGIYPATPRVQSFERWKPDGYWHSAPVKWIVLN